MNKKFLALAVAAASISTAASAANIYKDDTSSLNMGGRVEVRANFSDNNKSDTDDNQYKDASRVRLNFEGTQKLNDDISFYGFTEYELTTDDELGGDDTNFNTRYLFAGIQTTYGDLYYGHQDTSFTYLTNWTDRAENFSGYINEYNAATADRADNVLRYALSVDRLTIQAHVQGDSDSDGGAMSDGAAPAGAGVTTNNADGFGVIAAYALTDQLEIGAGYAYTDGVLVGGDTADSGDNYTYTAAIKYVNGGLWLATNYEGGKVSQSEDIQADFNAVDAFAGYTFGDNNVNITYNYYEVDTDNAASRRLEALNVNNIGLEYARYFGNATAFVGYKIELLDNDDVKDFRKTNDEIQAGLRYAF